MGRKTTKSVLSRDEISLLRNSEETKNVELYGNLYSVLCALNSLKAVTLEQLPDIDKKAEAALTYNKKTLINTVIKEWYAERVSEEDPTQKVRCGLCNTPNKYLYYIRNRKNNILLNVGSRCITNFPGLEGYIEQKKQLSQIHKGHKIINRRNEFYDAFPNCEAFIADAEKYFNTLPVLLPYELYTKLQDTIVRMRLIYTKYVNEGKKPFNSERNSFELFELAIRQYNKLKADAEVHIDKNINKPLICERTEIDWLISQNKKNILQQISENDGFYTLYTLKSMYSITYIRKHKNIIIAKNYSETIRFIRFNDNDIVLSFDKLGYQPPILFTVHLKDFMQQIGANCIFDNNFMYTSKDIHPILNITGSKNNIKSILGYIDNMIIKFNCVFLLDDTTNSLYLYRKGDRAVRMFSDTVFVRSYCKYILLSDKQIKNFLYTIIRGNNSVKWITHDIQVKQGIDNKIENLYKDYRDSHEYDYNFSGNKFELMIYGVSSKSNLNIPTINFDAPEYITIPRNKLKMSNSQLNSVEYGLHIFDDSMTPFFQKGDMLLIRSIQKIRNKTTVFFASSDGIKIKTCLSESGDPESIFDFINIPKRKLIAYGKIVYCIHAGNTKEEY